MGRIWDRCHALEKKDFKAFALWQRVERRQAAQDPLHTGSNQVPVGSNCDGNCSVKNGRDQDTLDIGWRVQRASCREVVIAIQFY